MRPATAVQTARWTPPDRRDADAEPVGDVPPSIVTVPELYHIPMARPVLFNRLTVFGR